MQHRAQSAVCSSGVGIWNGTPEALIRCFALRDALSHGRLGDQERMRDLRGGQSADRAQRQRDRRGRRQRRDGST